MKHIFLITLSTIILCANLLIFVCAVENNTSYYYGDVNKNGVVEPEDARNILRAAVQLVNMDGQKDNRVVDIGGISPSSAVLADVDRDGMITPSDARSALRTAVFLDEPVLCESNLDDQNNAGPLKEFIESSYIKLVQRMLKSDELEVEIQYIDPTTAQINFKLLKLTQEEKENYENELEAKGTVFVNAANNIKEKMLKETGLKDLKLICNFADENDNVLAKREF